MKSISKLILNLAPVLLLSVGLASPTFAQDAAPAKENSAKETTAKDSAPKKEKKVTKEKSAVSTEKTAEKSKEKIAVMKTSDGEIKLKLFATQAPKTVENFIGLATGKKEWTDPKTGKKSKKSIYEGTIFHRVIPDFMIQGGDPTGTGAGGPGYQFEDENLGASFDRPYLLAMANAGPGTNGSQFFITVKATSWLNGRHTIFGEVISGQKVVDKIISAERDPRDRPLNPTKIISIKFQ